MEVSSPSKILDIQSSASITGVDIKGFSNNIYSVSAQGENNLSIFLVKVSNKTGSEQKSKVKKKDSIMNLANANEMIFSSRIISESNVSTVFGSLF